MSRVLIFLLRLLGPRWGVDPAVAANLDAALRLGPYQQIPLALLRVATRLWSRGFLNKAFIETRQNWILPYWAERQMDPADPSFVVRGMQPVWLNQAHRDWTMVGNPQSEREAIVDPRGLVTPWYDGWSLDTWLRVGGELIAPSRLEEGRVEQTLLENLPVVQTRYDAAGLRVIQEAFAVRGQDWNEWVVTGVTVENPRGEQRSASVYLVIRPFNPEGLSLVRSIQLRSGEKGDACSLWIDGQLGGFIPRPEEFGCSDKRSGDVALPVPALNRAESCETSGGFASAAAGFRLDLPPHSQRVVAAILTASPRSEPDPNTASWTAPEQLARLRRATTLSWRELMQRGLCVRVPDDKLNDAFEASKAYLLLLHDGSTITPGPFLYHDFWFRDAAYMLNALGQLGYHDQVKQVLATFPRRMRKDGYYEAQDGEWDSNGQALWTLEQYTRLSGDLEVLADQYWTMLNGAHWIDAVRQRTKDELDSRHRGLMPIGRSAEHLGSPDYYYWDDFWGLAGLNAAAFAAHVFAKQKDEAKLRDLLEAFRRDVDRSLAEVAAKRDAAWMPASPNRTADSAMVANLVALYPLQLLRPDDPRIVATVAELKRVAWQDGSFFHNVGHGGFGTYLTLHIAGCYLRQRNSEAWPLIQWLLRHASSTYTWAEAIHPITKHGGMGDSPHGWTAADWISIVRNALLFEEETHLVLTPALPHEWTQETMSLGVDKAATWFGDVSFTIAFGEHAATLVLDTAWREPPEYVEWNLPFSLKNAGGDLPGVELVDNRVRIPSSVRKVVATW